MSFNSSDNAQFLVNRPKYMVQPNYPSQRNHTPSREGFMVPIPKVNKSTNVMLGSTNTPTSNPWMGGLPNEITLGPSVPGSSSTTLSLLSGNGQGNPTALAVWRTVI